MISKNIKLSNDELMDINHKWKRRKRIHRPRTLIFFGTFFLILPLINYIGIAIRFKHRLVEFSNIFSELHSLEIILLCIPIFVGIGILMVQTWGYYLFIFYASTLTIHNTITLFRDPAIYNYNSLFQTILIFGAIYYFLKKEVSAPYLFRPNEDIVISNILENYRSILYIPNGWRRSVRKQIEITVNVSNHSLVTKNFSLSGFYADWIDPALNPSEEVQLEFNIQNQKYSLKGGVVRVDENGVGIAFRNMTKEVKRSLQLSLNSL